MNIDWAAMAHGDVVPLPLGVETNWRSGHFEVNVIIVISQEEAGYTATLPLWSTTIPYDGDPSQEHAQEARHEALRRFAMDFARVLTSGRSEDSAH